jgi:hypothetical protein
VIMAERMLPDGSITACPQTDLEDVFGFVASLTQPARQRRWPLRIDEEAH